MVGQIVYQLLMFVVIWDIYLRLGGRNTSLENRILLLLLDIALCVWGQLLARYLGITLPFLPFVTLAFSYTLNKKALPVERFFLGFYPVVLADLARRFLATFLLPSLLGIPASLLNGDIWWSMIALAFVLPTVYLVDFILKLDFADILKVANQQGKKSRLGIVNMLLLLYYSFIFLVTAFDIYFPHYHLESHLREPLVLGYLYLLFIVLGAVNQFAKEKKAQDLVFGQAKYLEDLKRENARVEGLYRDLMTVRYNYDNLLHNLREFEKTGDIRASKRELVDFYVNSERNRFSSTIEELANIKNPSLYSLLSSKYHEAQMYHITVYAEIPDPIDQIYMTDLDLAVALGYLMDKAISSARQADEAVISLAYFSDDDSQSFIVESSMIPVKTLENSFTKPGFSSNHDGGTILQQILKRYPNSSFSTQNRHHKLMQILEMRP